MAKLGAFLDLSLGVSMSSSDLGRRSHPGIAALMADNAHVTVCKHPREWLPQ